jgi:hypothetical protein
MNTGFGSRWGLAWGSRRLVPAIVLPAALAVAFTASAIAQTAQTPVSKPAPGPAAAASAKTSKTYAPAKLPWGDPDLQGQWPAASSIPMQRPADLGTRAELTPEELAKREAQAAAAAAHDGEEFVAGEVSAKDVSINPPGYWVERGKPNRQASLVVDPPDGRIPALTAKGKADVQALRGGLGPGSHFPDKVDTWEDFDMYSRCVTRGPVTSLLPTLYNFGNQIVQGPGFVAIRSEMIHETRLIPLDGRPHIGKNIHIYAGDSRGHWDGNTLVVETTNFKPDSGLGGGRFSESAKLTERFTRTAADKLVYEATVDDPITWTKPWTLRMPYNLDPSYVIYEYACHEGNYMMLNALKGAREKEKEGQDTKVLRTDRPPLPN